MPPPSAAEEESTSPDSSDRITDENPSSPHSALSDAGSESTDIPFSSPLDSLPPIVPLPVPSVPSTDAEWDASTAPTDASLDEVPPLDPTPDLELERCEEAAPAIPCEELQGVDCTQRNICFPTPVGVFGLCGAPQWLSGDSVRTELDEPRWGAAPIHGFDSDITKANAGYRIMVDAGFTQLSVSFQALAELNAPGPNDAVFFGISTSSTTARVVRINLPLNAPTNGPVAATNGQNYTFDASAPMPWQAGPGIAPVPWLIDPAGWSNGAQDADWGINFKVDLWAAGISPETPFRIFLAIRTIDESTSNAVLLSTPPSGGSTVPDTPIPIDPTTWTQALPPNAGCVDGIQIFDSDLGTRNVGPMGSEPNSINLSNGATNRFLATPTYPTGMLVYPNMIRATFRIANWGSSVSPTAAWTPIPNGTNVPNGTVPATNVEDIEFDCPTNAGGLICGLSEPSLGRQALMVELSETPSNVIPITRAMAYTSMTFKALSLDDERAEISVQGLKEILGNDLGREVYIHVRTRNLPEPGSSPIALPTERMAAVRRAILESSRPIHHTSNSSHERRATNPKNLTPFQRLSRVWPTYDVRVYYDTGSTVTIDRVIHRQLQPMFPFTYFLSHDELSYGFAHRFEGVDVELEELRPNFFRTKIASEGKITVSTSIHSRSTPHQ